MPAGMSARGETTAEEVLEEEAVLVIERLIRTRQHFFLSESLVISKRLIQL
jgi:hypothetical protein